MAEGEPQPATGQETPVPRSRRRFVAVLGGGIAACVGLAYVGLQSFYDPVVRWFRQRQVPFRPIAAIDDLPVGEWKLVQFDAANPNGAGKTQEAVFVRKSADGPDALRVLSPRCPHKGCRVAWRTERKLFVCPCHGGTFDAEGKRTAGPPDAPLDEVDFRVEDGQVLVRFESPHA
jgi:menaquinol-cytochrome c reductase iron-sulfur subunit